MLKKNEKMKKNENRVIFMRNDLINIYYKKDFENK